MNFECYAKVSRGWSYMGTIWAADSLSAARKMSKFYRRSRWRIHPEGCPLSYKYRFLGVPS